MTRSESLGDLIASLIAARAQMGVIAKARRAVVETQKGGHFEYAYANLSDLLGVAVPALCEHGLVLVQSPRFSEAAVIVESYLFHVSGQWIGNELGAPLAAGGPQAIGSLISYLRRYAAQSLLGVAATEDDDAQAAERAATRPVRRGEGESDAMYAVRRALQAAAERGVSELERAWKNLTPAQRKALGVK